jgi:phosphoglycerol transferase
MIPIRAIKTDGWLVALLAGLVSLCIVFLRLELWRYDLSVPIVYWGDALYETVLVKALTEGAWNYHIPRLGAPFGMDAVDFPIGCTLDFFFIKLLSLVVRNPCLLINLYWLLTIGLAGAFATFLFKYLRISSMWAATFGVLYAIIPWVVYRNISHLNLVHFILPGAAYLGLSLAHGESFPFFRRNHAPSQYALRTRRFVFALVICVAVGLAYIYWAFFACIVIAIGCLIGFSRPRAKMILATALIYIFVIGVAAVADIGASFVYWHRNGVNLALNYKSAADADVYGLKIRHMLTPISEHPLPGLRKVPDRIIRAGFRDDDTESRAAALGTIGTAGFLILIAVAIVQPGDKIFGDPRMRLFSRFVIALVLIAGLGGFGSLFNIFVMHEFRCYDRVSPFVSLFSFGAVAVAFDHLSRRIHPCLQFFIAGPTILVASFDQVPVPLFRVHDSEERQFYQDQAFIHKLESRIPSGSMIFQLPNTGFPPDGWHERMGPYDNARAYLQSTRLRWSWGAMDGRKHDWSRMTSALPPSQFLDRIAFAGFDGVLLDRFGYTDATLEQALLQHLGAPEKFDLGGRWVFFGLSNWTNRLVGSLSESERAKRRDLARHPVAVEWGQGFSVEETDKNHTWRWCGKNGVMRVVNESDLERLVELDAAFQQHSQGAYPLRIDIGGASTQLMLATNPGRYYARLILKPHSSQDIWLRFLGPALDAPTDPRELAFRVVEFHLSGADAHNETSIQTVSSTALDTGYQLGTIIRFNDSGNSERFRGLGWSYTEADHTWTEGNSAFLTFSGLPPAQPLTLTMMLTGLTKDPQLPAQPVAAYANGKRVADWQVSENKEYTASIPADVLGDTGTLTIEFRIPKAASPNSLGVNTDERVLGLCVLHLVIEKGR